MRKIILYLLLFLSLNPFAVCAIEPERALAIVNESIAYYDAKQYDKVISLLSPLMAEYEADESSSFEDYVSICHLLGGAYYETGNVTDAENIYNKGLTVLFNRSEDVTGLPVLRTILCDLGLVYNTLRNNDKAEEYLAYAKYLYEQNLDMDIAYARCLNNLALVAIAKGNRLWAKCYMDVSVDVLSKLSQVPETQLAMAYSNIGVIYEDMGYLDEAESNINKSIALYKRHNLTHELPQALNNLGALYWKKGDMVKAQECFTKAYRNSDTNYSNHALLGLNLVGAQYLNHDRQYINSVKALSKEVSNDILGKFAFMPNELREQYWNMSNVYLQCCNAYLFDTHDSKNFGTIYNNALFSKGLLLRTSNWIRSKINTSDEKSREQLNELISLQSQLANGNISADSIAFIQYRIANLDRELTRSNADYSAFKEEFTFDWRKVRGSLGKGEAAIEFVEIPEIAGDSISRIQYAAIVITKDSKNPDIIPLCEEQQLRSIFTKDITTLSANGQKSKLSEYIRKLYSNGNPRLYNGEKLYSLIWEPIESAMENISTIYYSPIGLLYSIAFQAVSHDSVPLCDKYNLNLLSSTREVVRLKRATSFQIDMAAVYGGISYDAIDEDLIAEARSYSRSRGSVWSADDTEVARAGWGYLAGTEKESWNVYAKLQDGGISTILLSNTQANEESFKAFDNNSPTLIHLATHGFFLSDPKVIAKNVFMQRRETIPEQNHLLNRSGLLFAGANRAWTANGVIDGIEDGILTADEISRLNLYNTELVVLSACETGLGEIVSTEGVFGLQRAFKLAGVKSLIMSLWKVPDEATSKLMQLFYDNWLSGMEVHHAFAESQKQIREEYPSPYYWAGFVMLD